MKKSSSFSQNMGSFPSPGAPNYREKSLVNQKGWCSERVSKPTSSNNNTRRHTMAGLTPFSSGRAMPSKWDEAERWICSPVSVSAYSESRNSHAQFQRRPKSISGPIVPPGIAYYSNYSPNGVPLRQGLVVRNLMVGSPFSTGVLAPVAVSVYGSHDAVFGYDIDNGIQYSSSPVLNEDGVVHSSESTAHTCSELQCDPTSPNPQDEKHDGMKNEDGMISPYSRCDKGTQMSSPETDDAQYSSPKSSATSVMDLQDCHSPKLEVRDVQVDSQETVMKWSKRHATKLTKKDSPHNQDIREDSIETKATSWHVVESTLDSSKLRREEAKIIAWENLQKAKAEAEIRKLEMKLEKKKSSSMDKILNKLRRAHRKAENMRSSIPAHQGNQVSKTSKVFSFSFPKYAQIWSPSSCFGSHDP